MFFGNNRDDGPHPLPLSRNGRREQTALTPGPSPEGEGGKSARCLAVRRRGRQVRRASIRPLREKMRKCPKCQKCTIGL